MFYASSRETIELRERALPQLTEDRSRGLVWSENRARFPPTKFLENFFLQG
jgi:hypothetical protein